MKFIVDYSCSVCKEIYSSLDKANKCEEKGLIGPDLTQGFYFLIKIVKMDF